MFYKAMAMSAALVACGGNQAEPVAPTHEGEPAETEAAQRARKGGPAVQNELGEIDQKDAERAFSAAEGAIGSCHQKGHGKIEYLAGDVAFLVRIGQDGKARYVVIEQSTLGDRATERCMVDALMAARWPTPVGGEAEARRSLAFTPGDAREPTPWPADKMADAIQSKSDAIHACKKGASSTFHVTAYVQPAGKEGKIQALGVSASSPEGFAAADCVVDALKSAKVPSPGSYAAKVSFDL